MFRKVLLVTCAMVGASFAEAQDVRLVSDRAVESLNEASLLRQIDDDAVPQDYVAAARADYRRLLTALYGRGYYGGTVSITINGIEAADISPLAAPSVIEDVVITVDAGPQFRFGQTRIAPLPPATASPEDFQSGERARADQIERAVSAGLNAWRDIGHPRVRVADQAVIARHQENRLDVEVALAPGPQLTFGALNVSGNEDVRTERIRAIAGLPTGEVYSPDALDKAESRLRRTGAFDSVAFTIADRNGPNNTLPINAQILESKPRRIGVGLELSSVDGITTSAFWLHRNLLGGAERLRVDGEVSGIGGETGGIDYALRGKFSRPATFGPDTDYFLRGEISREDEPDYLLDKIAVETGFTRIVTDDLTVEYGVGLLRAKEESEVGDRQYTLLTLPLKATLDRRDAPSNATDGYYIDLSTTPFVSTDGDLTGARLFADGRGYYTIADRFTFAARTQVGSVLGAGLEEAPADFLFYSGGGGTVRGQPYQSLGIDRAVDGQIVSTGGASFAGAQVELRTEITDSLSLVGFYDIGYVGETSVPLEDAEWHAGAGIGIRYETGIGPIRLDLGTEASGETAQNLQVYIGIGQAF
ncbi:autotransporter assembly complex protein TamA [Yoonia sp. 2307UL14-13]|uniref:autotransporter assembly complex protein TamA n=1 Tax=Yoonia sp. 2307UL14-13 TaxID=3126506 RepID=UPI0030997753